MSRKFKTSLPKDFFTIERPTTSMEEALSDAVCPFSEEDLLKAKKKYERKKKVKRLPKELFENATPSNMTMEEALEDVICPFDEADLFKAKKKYERKKKIKNFFRFKKSN